MTRPPSHATEDTTSTDALPQQRGAEDLVVMTDAVPPSNDPALAPPVPSAAKQPSFVFRFVRQYSLPILLVISILTYSLWGGDVSSAFNTSANWQFITANQAVSGVLTLGSKSASGTCFYLQDNPVGTGNGTQYAKAGTCVAPGSAGSFGPSW